MSEIAPSLEAVVALRVAQRFQLDPKVAARALARLGPETPIPFLVRYRRDEAGGLDERTLREMRAEAERVRELEQRREFILRAIAERSDVAPKTRQRIGRCRNRQELEYLYEPYRPPRKTPGSLARERGLEPLADALLSGATADPEAFLDVEKGVAGAEQALAGAREILAERFAVDPDVRGAMLRAIEKEGLLWTGPAPGKTAIPDRYRQFRTYEERLSRVPPHRFLALGRAEKEGALSIRLRFEEERVRTAIAHRFLPKDPSDAARAQFDQACDAAIRRLRPAVRDDALRSARSRAEREAITVFTNNLCDLLLYPPAGPRRIMGMDPASRGTVPVAVLDERGQPLEHARLKLLGKDERKAEAARAELIRLVRTHGVELVALGSGQGRYPCEAALRACFEELGEEAPPIIIVNEIGLRSYASGPIGRADLPTLPVPLRGAVSLARRLMDPLRELVKLDPGQVGAGQYQADVDAQRMGRALADVVEHCVAWVGVDVNRAPVQQLAYVCGLSTSVARSLYEHRERHGVFQSLANIRGLNFMSDRAFEQSAGFLRIYEGSDPLDATGVHPAHAPIVSRIAERLGVQPGELIRNAALLSDVVAEDYADEQFSPATIAGVLFELVEGGRDPRPPLEIIPRPPGVQSASELKTGLPLRGRVTNVTSFGAFVDVGVQQDGLVHVSELADRFVKDPTTVVHVGQLVDVKVLGVDADSGRISLTMKSGRGDRTRRGKGERRPPLKRRPRREERPARKKTEERPRPPEPPAEVAPSVTPEDPVPSGMTDEEFMKHKLEELRRRFG